MQKIESNKHAPHKPGKMRLPHYDKSLQVKDALVEYCLRAGRPILSVCPEEVELILYANNAIIDQLLWQVFFELEMAMKIPMDIILSCDNVLDFILACDRLCSFCIMRNNWSGSECVEFIRVLLELYEDNNRFAWGLMNALAMNM